MPTALSINLNKIALLRNSREGNYPNVVHFAQLAIEAGANGLTVHPRPDQRHIRPHDVYQLSDLSQQHAHIEFNIEGNPFANAVDTYPGFMALVKETLPHQATLVPDGDSQLTSDHGFNLLDDGEKLKPIIHNLKQWGVRVSLFMDPSLEQIQRAKDIGADAIELYTGPYAAAHLAFSTQAIDSYQEQLQQYQKAAAYAKSIGLRINAGHDLNLDNLPAFLEIAPIAEVSIGHALTVDALLMGYTKTINAYSKICQLG